MDIYSPLPSPPIITDNTRPFIPVLSHYDIDPTTGFLPSNPPLTRLPSPKFDEWESALSQLRPLLIMNKYRDVILRLPSFPLSSLSITDLPMWRRANLILSMLTSAYVWGIHSTPNNDNNNNNQVHRCIPPILSIPLIHTAKFLGLRPIICYATSSLWNWFLVDPSQPIDFSNLGIINTFSGTIDESWFYLIPIGIELQGAPALPAMIRSWTAVINNDSISLLIQLKSMIPILTNMTNTLYSMHDKCDPHVFYYQVRPYVAGWTLVDGGVQYDGIDISTLPKSWYNHSNSITDTIDNNNNAFYFAGGSAGQSSLIQAFDVFLGISHHPTGTGPVANTTACSNPSSRSNFIYDMREYMPKQHRKFLIDAELHAPKIRDYIFNHANQYPDLVSTYNLVVDALVKFRDIHLRLVARYIIMPARKPSLSNNNTIPHLNPATIATVHIPSVNNNNNIINNTPTPSHDVIKRSFENDNDNDINNYIVNKRIRNENNTFTSCNSISSESPDLVTRSSPPPPSSSQLTIPYLANEPRIRKYSHSKLMDDTSIDGNGVRGTGGTQLIPFLKQTRAETKFKTIHLPDTEL